MDIEKVYLDLTKILSSSTISKNEPMSKHTTFKIGGNADIFIKAKSIEDIKKVLKLCNNKNIPLYIMGNGSNVLVKDNGIRGIVLIVDINDISIEKREDKAQITASAGVRLGKLARDLLKQNIGRI